jgi:hypothetical protein
MEPILLLGGSWLDVVRGCGILPQRFGWKPKPREG